MCVCVYLCTCFVCLSVCVCVCVCSFVSISVDGQQMTASLRWTCELQLQPPMVGDVWCDAVWDSFGSAGIYISYFFVEAKKGYITQCVKAPCFLLLISGVGWLQAC